MNFGGTQLSPSQLDKSFKATMKTMLHEVKENTFEIIGNNRSS